MDLFGTIAGVGQVLGGLGGLFGKKKKDSPARNLVSQAKGAREAAEKYGFNPLTMLQYGQTAGSMGGGGGAPPLASVQMLTDGLIGLDDIASGDAARRRAADQLNLDLAQLRVDQARSGVVVTTPHYATDGVGSGPSQFGKRAVTVSQTHGGDRANDWERPNEGHPLSDSLGDIPTPDPTVDRGAGTYIGGVYLEPPPGWTPGGQVEEEAGEPASWIYSPALIGAYAGHNLGRGSNYLRGKLDVPKALYEQEKYAAEKAERKRKSMPEYWTHPQTGFSAKRRPFPY